MSTLPLPGFKQACDRLDTVPISRHWKRTIEKLAYESDTFGPVPGYRAPTPLDVNINALGQTLWESGASPQLAGTTMGAMFAAQQIPDPYGREGYATGHQLGTLAAHAAGNYVTGLVVGKALNMLVGTPYNAPAFGAGAAALGIIGAVVPRLLGR